MAQLNSSLSGQISSGSQFPQKFDRACFAMHVKAVRNHPAIAWANRHFLDSDFEQLGLLEVLNVSQTCDPSFGTSPVQYVSVAMRSRLYNCFRTLQSTYFDKVAPAARNLKSQPNIDTESSFVVLDQFTRVDLHVDPTIPTDHDSYLFEFARSPVAENNASDRFTSCDEGQPYHPELRHDDFIDSVLQDLEETDQARQFMFFMDQLPIRQLEIVDLTPADYADQEIATTLQVTPQALHNTKHKAIAIMRTFTAGYMQ